MAVCKKFSYGFVAPSPSQSRLFVITSSINALGVFYRKLLLFFFFFFSYQAGEKSLWLGKCTEVEGWSCLEPVDLYYKKYSGPKLVRNSTLIHYSVRSNTRVFKTKNFNHEGKFREYIRLMNCWINFQIFILYVILCAIHRKFMFCFDICCSVIEFPSAFADRVYDHLAANSVFKLFHLINSLLF